MPAPHACALHLLNAGGALGDAVDDLRTCVESAMARAQSLLPLPAVDVVLYHDPAFVLPETGSGGYSPCAQRVFLAVDIGCHALDKAAFLQGLRSLVAHELHHCARWAGPGYGSTLGEALVSEGLACLFEAEMEGGPPPFYARALSPAQLAEVEQAARSLWDRSDYGHERWFYGAAPGDLPRHAGYSLGYALAAAQARRTGLRASQLVHAPAATFLQPATA